MFLPFIVLVSFGAPAAELAIVKPKAPPPAGLVPPPGFSAGERAFFQTLVKENRHLCGSDLPLLVAFCLASTRIEKLARDADVLKFEREIKTLIALQRTMRVSQQAVHDPKMLGQIRRNNSSAMKELLKMNGDVEKPWDKDDDDNEPAAHPR
jgi:hypothetical protein